MAVQREWTVGQHRARFEEPDVLFVKMGGLAWFRGIFFVGASIVEKAIGKAMTAAFSFTGRARTEMLYPTTIEEARALIEQLRAKQAAP